MSSPSNSARQQDASGSGGRKRTRQRNFSVAERLKMTQLKKPIGVKTDIDEDEEDDNRVYEDGVISHRSDAQERPKLMEYDQSTIRIVAQFLDGLGLKESVDKLVEESGCTVENNHAAKLRSSIMKGNYDGALEILDACIPRYLSETEVAEAKFEIQCFKIADCIRKRKLIEAIYGLREISQNLKDDDEKHKEPILLAFLKEIFASRPYEISLEQMRESQVMTLQNIMPANFMLPSNKLKKILDNAHGNNNPPNLPKKSTPVVSDKLTKCVQICNDHESEIWIIKFSNDGQYMASGSRNSNVLLWKVNNGKLVRWGRLDGVPLGYISSIEWSPRNKYVAICGTMQCKYNLTVFNVASKSIYRVIRVQDRPDGLAMQTPAFYTCCSFFNTENSHILIAATESGIMGVYNMEMPEDLHLGKTITGFRVRCVYGFKDGSRILASDSHNRLRVYHVSHGEEETIINEEAPILSFIVHPSEQFVLTTTSLNLRLWDIKSRTLVRYFSGACQQDSFSRYVIHATFGGVRTSFIATGSIGECSDIASDDTPNSSQSAQKDGRVCIWNMDDCRPVYKLKGHKGHVNCVAWNPKDPTMLVSCSDDSTIRVWNINCSVTDKESSTVPKRIPRCQKKKKRNHLVGIGNGAERNGKTKSEEQELALPPTSAPPDLPTFRNIYEFEMRALNID